MEQAVLPRLVARGGQTTIASAVLRTSRIPESTLAERIGSLEDALAPLTLAYLPSVAGVDLRLTAWDQPDDQARAQLADGIARLRATAQAWAYGEAGTDLAAVVVDQLRRRGSKLAIAESCTGGLLGGRITEIAGASDVFVGGIVACDNRVNRDLLAVPDAMLAGHGAVSAAVAQAMAIGAASRLDASVAVSVTGIAGPTGGSEEKPVGTVWFGFTVDGSTDTHKSVFGGTRTEIRERAAQAALWGLWQRLGGGGEK